MALTLDLPVSRVVDCSYPIHSLTPRAAAPQQLQHVAIETSSPMTTNNITEMTRSSILYKYTKELSNTH